MHKPEGQQALTGVKPGRPQSVHGAIRPILENKVLFGVNLYEAGLAEKVERMLSEMLTGDLVEEAFCMRGVMEGAVVELDCGMLTEDALARPRENSALQRRHLADGTMEWLWSLDNAFHSLLFQIARKEQTYQMMTGFTAHFDRVRNMSLVTVKNSRIEDDHALIVDALAARDKAAVRHLMARHLSRYKVDEAALRVHYPAEYFKQAK